jgi:hypothetical protein
MGHEMGHYVLGHVWRMVVFFSLLITATLYAIYRRPIGDRAQPIRFGFGDLSDGRPPVDSAALQRVPVSDFAP